METAKNVMTHNPFVCSLDDTAFDAVEIMRDEGCGVVPVVNETNQCVGVITDRDICLSVVLERLNPLETRLDDLMSHFLITCHPDDPLTLVLGKMTHYRLRRIPVLDRHRRCVGIISQSDISNQKRRLAFAFSE